VLVLRVGAGAACWWWCCVWGLVLRVFFESFKDNSIYCKMILTQTSIMKKAYQAQGLNLSSTKNTK